MTSSPSWFTYKATIVPPPPPTVVVEVAVLVVGVVVRTEDDLGVAWCGCPSPTPSSWCFGVWVVVAEDWEECCCCWDCLSFLEDAPPGLVPLLPAELVGLSPAIRLTTSAKLLC